MRAPTRPEIKNKNGAASTKKKSAHSQICSCCLCESLNETDHLVHEGQDCGSATLTRRLRALQVLSAHTQSRASRICVSRRHADHEQLYAQDGRRATNRRSSTAVTHDCAVCDSGKVQRMHASSARAQVQRLSSSVHAS